MIPTSRGLLTICVFFLLSLERAVFSQRGFCVRDKCFAFFSEPVNFPDAVSRCSQAEGKLFKFSPTNEAQLVALVGTHSGDFWLKEASSGEEKETTLSQNCSSIFVSKCRTFGVKLKPCSQLLDGFLCEYTNKDPCKSLQTDSGVHVSYNHPLMRVELQDSEAFPAGTLAVAEKVGSKFPDSRHVCMVTAYGDWLQAPWNCEVLGGGCDHHCSTSNTCICPTGQSLLPNNISCSADPCAHCAHGCNKDGDTPVCTCREGFQLAPDLKTCEEVSGRTEEMNQCTEENMKWDGSKCICRDNFYEYGGACVEFSICLKCEYKCVTDSGVDRCVCREGFRVSPHDSTKCEQYCPERQCLADCIPPAAEGGEKDCRCPEGYIRETLNDTVYCTDMDECDSSQCEQKCVNTFGSYKCSCERGFKLQREIECVRAEGEEEEEVSGSGEAPPSVPTPEAHPASGPSLIKTGGVLGVAVMVALFVVLLLYCLVRHLLKRCGKFQLSSLKHHDIDIFYLQQMTTGTYQRFSSDRLWKNPDPEII